MSRVRPLSTLGAIPALVVACSSNGSGPPIPASLTLDVEPQQATYAISTEVDITATVVDGGKTQMPNEALTWTADPASAVTAASDGVAGHYLLQAAGRVTFTACTVDTGSDGHPVCGEAVIDVAPSPPGLVVTTPTPGSELGGDGSTRFTVAGKVTDTRLVHVFVDGISVAVGSDGAFTTTVPATFGVDHLVVSADDGLNDEVRDEMDVLFGAAYTPAIDSTGAPAFALDDAIVLQLGQRFFDDAIPLPPDAPHPITAHDVADILQLVVEGFDVKSKLPDPIVDAGSTTDGVTLRATAVRLNDVGVQAQLVDGGLDLYVRVGALSIDTTGSLRLSGTNTDLGGGIDAAISAYAHATISKASPTAPIVVTVTTFDVAIESATGRFTDDTANAIFEVATSVLRTSVESQLKNALAGTLQTTIPAALEGVFQGLDGALSNKVLSLDAAPLPPVTVTLNGHIATLDTKSLDFMRAVLPLAISTDHATASHPTSKGVALVDTSVAEPLFDSPRVQLAVRLALLNGLLHTLWNSGLLEVPTSSAIPVAISGKLPPVARLPRADEPYDLVVSLGELEVVPNDDLTNGKLGVLLEAGVNLELASNKLTIKIADKPSITTWTITPATVEDNLFTPSFMKSLLLEQVWPKLQTGLAQGLSIALPIPPLDSIASVAPNLAGMTISIGTNRAVAYRSGFLVLDTDIAANVP